MCCQIQELSSQLASLGHKSVPQARVEYVMRAKSVEGDPVKAFKLLMLFEDSVGGVLRPYDSNVKMLGAENREKVTCYLDALLFAMFAKTDVFEAILFHDPSDEPRKRLLAVLRLWVNMLRTGRLITTDIVRLSQLSLASAFTNCRPLDPTFTGSDCGLRLAGCCKAAPTRHV